MSMWVLDPRTPGILMGVHAGAKAACSPALTSATCGACGECCRQWDRVGAGAGRLATHFAGNSCSPVYVFWWVSRLEVREKCLMKETFVSHLCECFGNDQGVLQGQLLP